MGRAESLLLFNLKNLNLLKSDVNDSQSEYITPQEDYKFYFIRSSPKISNSNFQYLCKWIITTYPIQHTLLELLFHENDIYYLIDNITQFIEYNFETLYITIPTCNQYYFYLCRNPKVYNNIFFEIYHYQSNLNQSTPKLRIEFDEESITRLIDLLYFTFLFDIDSVV